MNLFSFIKQKISILTVINEYVTLKKAGYYWKGSCPFHHERTASFTVSPHKEIFHCFGCQAGGDVISFIEKTENCSALQAAKFLAERYNVALPDELNIGGTDAGYKEKKRYVAICTFFSKWSREQLALNQTAIKYLESRLISKQSVMDFGLGYFPAGPMGITKLLDDAKKENIVARDFIDAQLIKEGKSGLYCPFEGRILFPISDHLGAICGFGGRVYIAADDRVKYYNSHDHAFFNKGTLLYGLDKAKKNIQQSGTAFLVEGYTDLIAMFEHGYKNTVASLGTACTSEHLNHLSRYANRLYVLYDGDLAGQKAIIRLISLCWNVSVELFVIRLPNNEDPASYLNLHKTLDPLIQSATDIFSFFITYLGDGFNNKSMQERISDIKQLIVIIQNLDDEVKQDMLLQKASLSFSIPFNTLKAELNKTPAKKRSSDNRIESMRSGDRVIKDNSNRTGTISDPQTELPDSIQKEAAQFEISSLEKRLFSAILVDDNNLSSEDTELLFIWLSKSLKIIFKKVIDFKASSKADVRDIFCLFEQSEKELVSKLIMEVEDGAQIPIEQLLLQFYKKHWKTLVYNVRLSVDNAQKSGNVKLVEHLLAKLDILKKKMLRRGIT